MPTPQFNPNLSQTKRKPVSYPFIFPSLWGQHSHKPWLAYYCIFTCSWSLKVMTYTLDDTFSLLLNFPFFKQNIATLQTSLLCCNVTVLCFLDHLWHFSNSFTYTWRTPAIYFVFHIASISVGSSTYPAWHFRQTYTVNSNVLTLKRVCKPSWLIKLSEVN